MLATQLRHWMSYPLAAKRQCHITVVDDGSPRNPAITVLREASGLSLDLYRIRENIPWNQHGARNLGAFVAKPLAWLFISDIDIAIGGSALEHLLRHQLDPNCFYTFPRRFYRDVIPPKVHWNTFLLRRELYWKTGGYDEDYCGTYGGDAPFRDRLSQLASRIHLHGVNLIGYTRDVVRDADTLEWSRQGDFQNEYLRRLEHKKANRIEAPCNPLRFTWEKVLSLCDR